MHKAVQLHLEQYLGGASEPSLNPEFHSHLAVCRNCRREVESLAAQSRLLRLLAPEQEIEASPGFYSMVMSAVEARGKAPVVSAFLDPSFGRRLVYACLTTVLVLGSYLVFVERGSSVEAWGPVSFMASDAHDNPHVGDDPRRDREAVLLALASYQE